jgi:hypothetical protein
MNVLFLVSTTLALLYLPYSFSFCEVQQIHSHSHSHSQKISSFQSMILKSTQDSNNSNNDRKPWEVLRFLRQSSKFVSLPFLGGGNNNNNNKEKKDLLPGDVLWKADADMSKQYAFTMAPLDDVVMGGASSSTFDVKTGIWAGTVTDANNGGFIGIRSTPGFLWNMEQCNGLEYKLKTSTLAAAKVKRFKFIVRDSTEFNGITWATSADVKPGVSTVKVPFSKQVPTLFAKTVENQTFRKDNVVGIQIAFSKFEYDGGLNPKFSVGGVNLQIIEIRAY